MGKLLTILLFFFIVACQNTSKDPFDPNSPFSKVELLTPKGDSIKTKLAITPDIQEQGLSGIRSDDFQDDQGMLFFYISDDLRQFWMPDTYFDLDLFYLDKNLTIINIIRRLPFYIGRQNPDQIPRAPGIWARHVLEMKSSSKIAENLKVGDSLKWEGKMTLEQLESYVRENLK